MNQLQQIAQHFSAGQPLRQISPLGNGLINHTFLVDTDARRFVLQGLNSRVFPQPEQVISNLQQLNRHIAKIPPNLVQLQIPALLPTTDGQAFYRDESDQLWRALELIQPAESREQLSNDQEASQVGFALAHFHGLCSDLVADTLHDTLPGFHITPHYFDQHLAILAQPLAVELDAEVRQCQDFIVSFQDKIGLLEDAKLRGELRERVIHGDPKLNNFLFQPNSDRIVSLIDLDTVKPGLVHYDIGDCLRSCCHIRHKNQFDLPRCQIILTSYLEEAGAFFTPTDYAYLYAAIFLIPFELGLRFFSDYLQGNVYFKVSEPKQNLQRALDQFALTQNIASQQAELLKMIESLNPAKH